MKAWQVIAKEEVKLVELTPTMENDDVKVKITKAAFSSVDLAVFQGKHVNLPIIPVRTAVGQVSEASELSGLKKGERVFINPYSLDKDVVVNKKYQLVPEVKVMGIDSDGLLSDFVVVNQDRVCYLPDSIEDEDALFIEYTAMGIKTLEALDVEKGNYIVILGANSLGKIIAQLAIYYQVVPIVVDADPRKLALAESYGVYYTINSTDSDVYNRVLEITGGKMAEYCVYEARSSALPTYAIPVTQECGKIALVGYNKFVENIKIDFSQALNKQLTVIGVNNGYGEIYTAINLLANKAVKTTGMISETIAFSEVPKHLKELCDGSMPYQKIVINC